MFGLYKDGKLLGKFKEEWLAAKELHKIQGNSVSYALKYGGYNIQKIPSRRKKK